MSMLLNKETYIANLTPFINNVYILLARYEAHLSTTMVQ